MWYSGVSRMPSDGKKTTQITIVELVHLEIQYKTSYRQLLKETTMSVRKVLGIFTEQFTLLLSLT